MENKCKSKTPEYVKKYNTEYYQKTRTKRLEAIKEKIYCDICCCDVSKGRLQRHNKTKKHISKIKVKDDTDDSDDSDDE
jgi:hypothetical protein